MLELLVLELYTTRRDATRKSYTNIEARLELASTGRAGCKNKECQEKKEKILKGELRLGTFVDTEQFQSWAWKHW